MKQKIKTLLILCALILTPSSVFADSQNQSDVLIVEVQTGSLQSASEEFIEIYNTTTEPIDISNWKIEYYTASTIVFGSPSRTIALSGILYGNGRYLIASTNYLSNIVDTSFSSTLAKSGGHIRLVSPDESNQNQLIEHDLIGWGTAQSPEIIATPAPSEGTSLVRLLDQTNQYIDSDNNSLDFEINTVPTPESNNISSEPDPIPDPDSTPDPDPINPNPPPEDDPQPTPTNTLLDPIITELLPNPASPQTDDQDEFIELYNPNSENLDLENYKLQTGNSFNYSYVFDSIIIPPKSFMAFYSKDTNLILSNSGSQARLVDPSGLVVDSTSPYEEADEGNTWAKDISGSWKWTIQPTPSAQNVFVEKTVATKKLKTKKLKKSKSKVASAKSKKRKTSVKKVAKDASEQFAQIQEISPLHPAIIAGVGIAVIIYGAYEYRNDIANKFHELKTNRRNRRKNR